MAGETQQNPIHMKIVGTDAGPGKMVAMALLTLAPVAVAILMQNPALRQKLAMNFWHTGELVFWRATKASDKARQICRGKYDLVRL